MNVTGGAHEWSQEEVDVVTLRDVFFVSSSVP